MLYAEKWKDSGIPTMEEWLVKVTELAEVAKLTSLIRERTITTFISGWNILMDFLLKKEENKLVIYGFDD